MSADISSYIHGHFSDEVSKSTLIEMLGLIDADKRVALLGFSDYTKHIINNFGNNIVAVFDIDPRFEGFRFREQTVVCAKSMDSYVGLIDVLLVCAYDHVVTYFDLVDRSALRGLPVLWPEDFGGEPGHKFNLLRQSPLYQYRNTDDRLGEPPTMMPRETIIFLTELLHASLRVPGDVAEIGVWQGGSAWNMAKMMQALGEDRPLHLFDFFDSHTRTNPEAIMCLDEIKSRFSFYRSAHFYRGMANELMANLHDRSFCFVHIDLGFQEDVLEFFWNRMNPGSMLALDNYGHVRASPGLFDEFFARRGYSIVRSPFSYQAFVVK